MSKKTPDKKQNPSRKKRGDDAKNEKLPPIFPNCRYVCVIDDPVSLRVKDLDKTTLYENIEKNAAKFLGMENASIEKKIKDDLFKQWESFGKELQKAADKPKDAYYDFLPIPSIEIIEAVVAREQIKSRVAAHFVGDALKYLLRLGLKPGADVMDDIRKAENFLHRARTGEWMK